MSTVKRTRTKPSGLLSWERPEKAQSTEKHNSCTADGAPPGVYVPNMSEADARKWRAKLVGGKDPRVEVRTTQCNANLVLIVRPHEVKLSMNGPACFDATTWEELQTAVREAKTILAG